MHSLESATESPVPAALKQAAAQLANAGEAVEILALTADHELFTTLRASMEQRHIWHAPSFQEAAELIMTGRIGVAVIDTATTGEHTAPLCERFRSQFPDLVLIVTGSVDDQTHLVRHITSGDIYRFMHKPVSEARARQFIEASVRRHLDGRTIASADAHPGGRRPDKRMLVTGAVAAAALVLIVGLALRSGDDKPAAGGQTSAIAHQQAAPVSPRNSGLESPASATAALAPSNTPAAPFPVPAAPAAAKNRATTTVESKPATEAPQQPAPTSSTTLSEPAAATEHAPAVAEAASVQPVVPEPKPVETAAAVEQTKAETVDEKPVAAGGQTHETAPESATAAPVVQETPATEAATAAVEHKSPDPPVVAQPSPREAFLANVVSGISLPRVKQVDPVYPSSARRQGTEGWVEAEFTVGIDGRVSDIDVRKAEPQGVFDKAAAAALAQWKFKPVLREGQPVEQRARIRLRFTLKE